MDAPTLLRAYVAEISMPMVVGAVVGLMGLLLLARRLRRGRPSVHNQLPRNSCSVSSIGTPLKVDQIWIYPLKAAQGQRLPSSRVVGTGLAFDRYWTVVDSHTGVATAIPQFPKMLRLRASIDFDRRVMLLTDADPAAPKDASQGRLEVPLPPDSELHLPLPPAAAPHEMPAPSSPSDGRVEDDDEGGPTIGEDAWAGPAGRRLRLLSLRTHTYGFDEGDEAAAFVSAVLQRPTASQLARGDSGDAPSRLRYRLVRFDPKSPRVTKRDPLYTWSRNSQRLAFSYNANYLIASTASLRALNQLDDDFHLTMQQMRVNISVRGCQPWQEDNWTRVRLGANVVAEYFKPCHRCVAVWPCGCGAVIAAVALQAPALRFSNTDIVWCRCVAITHHPERGGEQVHKLKVLKKLRQFRPAVPPVYAPKFMPLAMCLAEGFASCA